MWGGEEKRKKKASCFPGKRCNSHFVQTRRIKLVIPGGGFPSCFLFSEGCVTITSSGTTGTTRELRSGAQRGSGRDPPCLSTRCPGSLSTAPHCRFREPADPTPARQTVTPETTGKRPLTVRQGGLVSEKFKKDFRNNQKGWRNSTIKPG